MVRETVPEVSETKQGTTSREQRPGLEAAIWTEAMASALENGVKGGKWFSLMDKVYSLKTLSLAWQRVKANKGAAGVDGQSIWKFSEQCEKYLRELSESLKSGSYEPQAVRRVYVPKGQGGQRPLGIPAVKDRIVQTAVKMLLEPIFEKEFQECSYGFRPGRGAKDALREVAKALKDGKTHVVDADLKSYFDTIPHECLMAKVEERISDGRILKLLRSWLKQEIMEPLKRTTPTSGTPQGAVISPLLANIYLNGLDRLMLGKGYAMVRYADDFVVMCESHERAETALEEIRGWVEGNGLELHPEKTNIGDFQEKGKGFEFLGYRFESGKRRIRKSSLRSFKDKVRSKTRRTRGQSLAMVIADLNPMLQGWFGYFKHATKWTYDDLDGWIRRRLRALLSKQLKKPGSGRTPNAHKRWPNEFFAEAGLFTMYTAWHEARCPR